MRVCAAPSVVSDSLRPRGLYPGRPLCPWNSPGRNTGVGCHLLLQGIFPTQESNQKVSDIPCTAGGLFTLAPPRKLEALSVIPKHRTVRCLVGETCVRRPLCSLMVRWQRTRLQCERCKRCGLDPWVGKILWRRARQPTPVFLPRESHGQRGLVGYSPRVHKESDTNEAT